jgi:hypothetical protein
MIEIVKVVEVKPLADHTAFVCFRTARKVRRISLGFARQPARWSGPLADEAFFSRVFLSNGVPTWPNGFDVDAINLHREMAEQGRLRKTAA